MSDAPKKTRGVFALILAKRSVLVSERQDGKGWNLPGGRVEEGESDHDALAREVWEETGLEIEVLEQVGPPHVFNDDTAVAYACRVIGGQLVSTSEAKQHWYANATELKQGFFRVRHKEYVDGISMTTGFQDVPLTLVGPTDRLGRTGRMVWDGLSLLEDPILGPNEAPEEYLPIEGVFVSDDGCFLIDETVEGQKKYPRLDPYSPTGKMEPK
ncbi:MAG: hydrolase [Candidatus Peribacteria bacterium]|nr:hydrolase [Candidatus Peribacteria bacterium]